MKATRGSARTASKHPKTNSTRHYWYHIWATTSIAGARERYKKARAELRKMIRKAKTKWYEKKQQKFTT